MEISLPCDDVTTDDSEEKLNTSASGKPASATKEGIEHVTWFYTTKDWEWNVSLGCKKGAYSTKMKTKSIHIAVVVPVKELKENSEDKPKYDGDAVHGLEKEEDTKPNDIIDAEAILFGNVNTEYDNANDIYVVLKTWSKDFTVIITVTMTRHLV